MSDEQLEDKIENIPPPPQEELVDYKEKFLRVLAETENTRKRLQKEKAESIRFSIDNILTDLIQPMDNLESALKSAAQMSADVRNWAIGFDMILSQFKDVLKQHGVSSFESHGQIFDPNLHEAVETEESDAAEEGTILQEFVKGYKRGEHIIRPARVKVAKKNLEKETTDESE
jgi:molecular chaperone GrpE